MNNDEINLTPEQQKNLDTKIREKERVEDLNKELTEKAEKIKGKDYQNKKETYERDIRQIDEDIDNANKINERIRAKLDSYASATGSGEPQEIYRVFIPGGNELRLNYYQLNNIGKQMNVYFSRLDNPFLDSYNDTQREELARSILGTPVGTPIPTTPKATMTDNDKTDANWRKKEPQPGKITEPTYHSYEWFQRWWEFLRNYARKELVWGTYEELKKIKPVIEMHQGSYNGLHGLGKGKAKVQIFDTIKFAEEHTIDRIYGSWFDDYLPKTRGDTSAKAPFLFVLGGHGPAAMDLGINCVDHISFSMADWICLFNEEFFPTDTLHKNLLINNNISGDANYKVGPAAWAETHTYAGLHTTYFTLISGKSDNLLLQSYELHGAPKNGISEASNYIEVKTGDLPYKFEQVIAPGLRGMIDLSHDIYDKGNIKGEFYKNEPVLSLKSCGQTKTLSNFNTDGTPPSYFTLKKIDFGTMGKGEISSFVDVDQKIKEKADKQKQLEDLDIDYYEANRKALEAEIRINNKRIAELTREIEALSGTSEKKLRDQLVRTAKRIKDTIGKRKQTTEWFENFTNGVEKLNKIVWERLKNEPQNKGKLDDYKEFNIRLADKSDQYFNDKDETKTALTTGDIREAWKKYNDDIWSKIEAPLARLGTLYANNKITRDRSQFETWLKDKNNAKVAQAMLKELDELKEIIILNEFDTWAVEKIRDSESIAKDLEVTLREILGSKYRQTIRDSWRKMGYGEGNDFHELVTYKTNLHNNDKFKTWLNGSDKGGPGYSKTFAEWLADKSLSEDPKSDILAYILRYRLNEYIEASMDDRKGYKKEIVLGWINKTKSLNIFTIGDFEDVNGGDNKKGDEVLNSFIRSLARPLGDVMDLDPSKNSEYRTIEKWMEKNYKAETVKSLKEGMDEEFMKGRDAKGIWDTDPGKLHKEVRDYQISKEGVTSENYKEFKEKDKEKLEKVLSYLEDLIEHKLADEKQIEFKKQLSSHIATLTTPTPPSGDGKGDGKGEEGKGDGKGETQKPTDDKKWWQKAGYAVFWAPILGILLIGGLGYALGWWGGKKEEDTEEATSETEEGGK